MFVLILTFILKTRLQKLKFPQEIIELVNLVELTWWSSKLSKNTTKALKSTKVSIKKAIEW